MKILPTVDEIVDDWTARQVTREILNMGVAIVVASTGITRVEAREAVARLIAAILEERK